MCEKKSVMYQDEGSQNIPLGKQEEEWKEETLNAPLIGLTGVLPFFTQF
jgi:hypothetical protein